jgi:hypothetical protein
MHFKGLFDEKLVECEKLINFAAIARKSAMLESVLAAALFALGGSGAGGFFPRLLLPDAFGLLAAAFFGPSFGHVGYYSYFVKMARKK